MDQRFAAAAFPTLSAFTALFDPCIERDLKKKKKLSATLCLWVTNGFGIHHLMKRFCISGAQAAGKMPPVASAGRERQASNFRDYVQTDWDGLMGGGHQQTSSPVMTIHFETGNPFMHTGQ